MGKDKIIDEEIDDMLFNKLEMLLHLIRKYKKKKVK